MQTPPPGGSAVGLRKDPVPGHDEVIAGPQDVVHCREPSRLLQTDGGRGDKEDRAGSLINPNPEGGKATKGQIRFGIAS